MRVFETPLQRGRNAQPTSQLRCFPERISWLALCFSSFLGIAAIGKLAAVMFEVDGEIHPVASASVVFLELLISLGLIWNSVRDRSFVWRACSCLGAVFLASFVWKRLSGDVSGSCGCLGIVCE